MGWFWEIVPYSLLTEWLLWSRMLDWDVIWCYLTSYKVHIWVVPYYWSVLCWSWSRCASYTPHREFLVSSYATFSAVSFVMLGYRETAVRAVSTLQGFTRTSCIPLSCSASTWPMCLHCIYPGHSIHSRLYFDMVHTLLTYCDMAHCEPESAAPITNSWS